MAWREGDMTFLNLTLQALCLVTSTCRGNSNHSRLIFGFCCCTVDICTAKFNFWCLTDKRFDWCEGNIPLCINLELTNFGKFFDIRAGVKDRCTVFWESDLRTSGFKSNLAFLSLALKTLCLSTCGPWSHFFNRWRVIGCHRSAIFVHSLNNNWIWRANILLIWGKGNRTVWCHFKDTDIWNNLALASVVESSRSVIIQWYSRSAAYEVWLACLWAALLTSAGNICSRWNHFFHHCLVFDGNWCAIHICSNQCQLRSCPLKLLVWRESNLTIGIHFKFTNGWNLFNSQTIVKEWSCFSWEWYRRMTRREGDLAFLNLAL
ncbi:hypothetical protein D8886_06310 [Streptococcus sanguinis]|uniref:Uncharacterized protein n=1 Tax=Streptococcus sanguinis TaxID=1305 RepID=A0AAE8FW75_STRSA|nr:hypothetical protein D8888_04125 [Streptococcus sanguinis]RSI17338.1 hypothetical protein D8886_06310 [Streptococcus sanguinis]